MNKPYRTTLFLLMSILASFASAGQNMLQKRVTVQAQNQPVREVLKSIEKQAGFYFSYNNNIIHNDSLVTVSLKNKSVEEVLKVLFNNRYQYIESSDHLIIQPAVSFQYWYVSGIVVDKVTGEPISYATVYERQQLISTMTDENGRFRLSLRERRPNASISISKVSYADTLIMLSSEQPQDIRVGIQQVSYVIDSIVISGVEKNWLADAFLSSKQTMNSLNLDNFFSKQPFQFSLTPGLGSHGRMGAQVVNKFSLNVLGGYTAGVNGFELGTLFNIVKHDMGYAQIAGLFNIVGGNVSGVQIGGLYNSVLDSVNGIQIAGLSNIVAKDMKGIQIAGLYNHAFHSKGIQIAGWGSVNVKSCKGVAIGGLFNSTQNMDGVQIAGFSNVNVKETKGVQIAGIANVSTKGMNGLQIAGFVNITKKLKGVQIGFINIADTSEGYSIGFLNVILKGYHKVSISTSEMQHLTVSYKSGNQRLYSILTAGMQLDNSKKAYSVGYGLGSDRSLGKGFYLNPELTHQYFYTGDEEQQNLLSRLQLNIKYKLGKYCAIYAGPAFSILYAKQKLPVEGYSSDLSNGYPKVSFGKEVIGWIGWNVGLDLF
ncbi:MAG: STN and carboxypeptidase regulatory-like domain-containing protein [Taibaiella sp.]|jgi:hypothetical protein